MILRLHIIGHNISTVPIAIDLQHGKQIKTDELDCGWIVDYQNHELIQKPIGEICNGLIYLVRK